MARPSLTPADPAALAPYAEPAPGPAPPRDLARGAARLALAAAWRSLNPERRERFATPPQPAPLERQYVRTEDGWECPLWRLSARPGTTAEPVVLCHGLALNRHSLDYAPELSLARALADAGFEVFVAEHRGVRGALPPPGSSLGDLDDIARHDLPAALDRVRGLTGAARPLFVGHGLGAQALYAAMGQQGAVEVAAACAISAPVRFERPRSNARALSLTRLLLPPGWTVPVRAASALLCPTARPGEGGVRGLGAGGLSGEVARGLLLHGAEDVGGALVRQALRWLETGTLCDRTGRVDYAEAIVGLGLPLQVISAAGDPLAQPEPCELAPALLGGPREQIRLDDTWGALDPLLDARAATAVYPAVAAWLDRWRERCW